MREGRISTADAVGVPCLVDSGLLHPALDDPGRLEPVAPVVALHRLLRSAEGRIAEERRRETRLTEMFEPLIHLDGRRTESAADTPGSRLLDGNQRIDSAITDAMTEASKEVLCIQPYTVRKESYARPLARQRDQTLLDRGGRIRTIYQHTLRHAPDIIAYQEHIAKPAAALGSESRAQLGCLIARSGVLDPDR
ncbi:hypothetical protein ACH5A3_20170 [Streptomyces echinatus]|uniref:hypothetical protein n=1 Tax=Streptomyces echinatus TaxID=67293 RepID=UPI00378BB7DA